VARPDPLTPLAIAYCDILGSVLQLVKLNILSRFYFGKINFIWKGEILNQDYFCKKENSISWFRDDSSFLFFFFPKYKKFHVVSNMVAQAKAYDSCTKQLHLLWVLLHWKTGASPGTFISHEDWELIITKLSNQNRWETTVDTTWHN
jgi:hypothetical protein